MQVLAINNYLPSMKCQLVDFYFAFYILHTVTIFRILKFEQVLSVSLVGDPWKKISHEKINSHN